MKINILREFTIHSESPREHWMYLDVCGKRVLDCGCGRWDAVDKSDFTPIYFLNQGAEYIIGIDISQAEINFYNSEKISNSTFILDNLNTADKLINIINEYKIQTIKMDIEGNEKILFDVQKKDFIVIEQIAVEYHLSISKDELLAKLVELGFKDFTIGYLWIQGMGVIFAKK